MIVNPEKFKAILLTKGKENTAGYPIILRGHEIESEDLVTLLGVTIDYKLSFENHIQELCQRTSAQLNALKRPGYFMEPKIRKTMIQSFILAHFNYCPLVWYFTSANKLIKLKTFKKELSGTFQMIMTLTINSSLKTISLYQWKLKKEANTMYGNI